MSLKILPVNKTFVFNTPLEEESVLVRTGTIGDGSCFFHAVLHAYSQQYVKSDTTERVSIVKKIREGMTQHITKEQWVYCSSSKVQFEQSINNLLTYFYKRISKYDKIINTKGIEKVLDRFVKNDDDKIEICKLMIELIPLEDGFEKNIIPDSCSDDLPVYKNQIVQNTVEYVKNLEVFQEVQSDNRDYLLEQLDYLMNVLVDDAENTAYNNYLKSLRDTEYFVDNYMIETISKLFKRNIYFIDSKTRMPYRLGDSPDRKYKKNIILMYIENRHYEIIGRLLNDNKVQREFLSDDPLIVKIDTLLYEPRKVKNLYPSLISYIPGEYKDSDSESNSDNSSHYCYSE